MIFKQVHLQNRQDYPMAMVGKAWPKPSSFLVNPSMFSGLYLLSCWLSVQGLMIIQVPWVLMVNLRMFLPFCWMKSYVFWFQTAQVNTVLMMNASHIPNLPPFLTGSVYQIVSRKDLQFLMPTILGKPSFFVGSNRFFLGLSENGIKPQVLAIKFHWLVINHETCS